MKRVTALIVALVVLAVAASALGSQAKHCGVVSYSWVRDGQRYSGKDAVFVLRGATSCATARRVDSRADEGLRTLGWRCPLLPSTQRSRRAQAPHNEQRSKALRTPLPRRRRHRPLRRARRLHRRPTPTPTPTPTGCYPLTNSGGCYEPGEYCRDTDHGVSGVAGDGEAIMCGYNNGWRWEPSRQRPSRVWAGLFGPRTLPMHLSSL